MVLLRGKLRVLEREFRAREQKNIPEAQRMRSSLEASRYRKLKPRVKGSLRMSQLITLVFSINGDVQ